jgi:hypothetical protein
MNAKIARRLFRTDANYPLESLLEYCSANRRICPRSRAWHALWELLPNRRRTATGWKPTQPPTLATWSQTTAPQKILALASHIHWADRYGGLEAVDTWLRKLPESEWLHDGD